MDLIDKVINRWNDCSQAYADEAESGSLQSAMTLYNLVNATKAKRIIDAGCGPGLSSQALVSTLMKTNTTLYCLDIAEKMVDMCDCRFRSNDFSKNPDNCYRRLDYSDVRTTEKLDQVESNSKVGPTGRRVYSMVADVEQMPFPASTFDAYTANMVLQFTPNYLNMLCEAYRILKSGGKAAFSVWGREENCSFVTFVPDILEKHGVRVDPDLDYNFDSLDVEQIIEDAKELGFKSVKSFNLPSHYSIMSGGEMWEFLMNSSTRRYLEKIEASTLSKIQEDVIKEFDQRYGEQSEDMISFEVTIILCSK